MRLVSTGSACAHEVQRVTLHGHERAFVRAGSGPALLLLHGLACDHTTWHPVISTLARRFTVIAPDLLGHGASAKPRADYSVGGYANGMRDLLEVLGIERATVVGHSLGGGVAMQFAYQYPERTERLALISPGGFGPEVSAAIRAITTPGFQQLMGVLTLPGVRHLTSAWLRTLAALPVPYAHPYLRDLDEVAGVYESFADRRALAATRHVVRAVVDWKGQIITMTDRAYLTEHLPLCVIWGREDRVIPVEHATIAAAIAPAARVEVIPNAGHFPHKDHPDRVARILTDFVRTTSPSAYDPAVRRAQLRSGGDRTLRRAEAGEFPLPAISTPTSA